MWPCLVLRGAQMCRQYHRVGTSGRDTGKESGPLAQSQRSEDSAHPHRPDRGPSRHVVSTARGSLPCVTTPCTCMSCPLGLSFQNGSPTWKVLPPVIPLPSRPPSPSCWVLCGDTSVEAPPTQTVRPLYQTQLQPRPDPLKRTRVGS